MTPEDVGSRDTHIPSAVRAEDIAPRFDAYSPPVSEADFEFLRNLRSGLELKPEAIRGGIAEQFAADLANLGIQDFLETVYGPEGR